MNVFVTPGHRHGNDAVLQRRALEIITDARDADVAALVRVAEVAPPGAEAFQAARAELWATIPWEDDDAQDLLDHASTLPEDIALFVLGMALAIRYPGR